MPLTKHILAMLGLLAAFAASAHAGDLHYGDGTAYSGEACSLMLVGADATL
jgi:hypothetical protein